MIKCNTRKEEKKERREKITENHSDSIFFFPTINFRRKTEYSLLGLLYGVLYGDR